VFGMVNDKSTETIKLLPKQADYYLCEANIPRAMPIKQLDGLIRQNGLNIKSNSKSVKSAYFDALKNAKSDDLILIIGSLFVVAEVLECIEN
ncbi:MAG: bifunctional folylpolyglutamate synthase/dihydrofolate synthase, partial [Bacteroidia bacterium]